MREKRRKNKLPSFNVHALIQLAFWPPSQRGKLFLLCYSIAKHLGAAAASSGLVKFKLSAVWQGREKERVLLQELRLEIHVARMTGLMQMIGDQEKPIDGKRVIAKEIAVVCWPTYNGAQFRLHLSIYLSRISIVTCFRLPQLHFSFKREQKFYAAPRRTTFDWFNGTEIVDNFPPHSFPFTSLHFALTQAAATILDTLIVPFAIHCFGLSDGQPGQTGNSSSNSFSRYFCLVVILVEAATTGMPSYCYPFAIFSVSVTFAACLSSIQREY